MQRITWLCPLLVSLFHFFFYSLKDFQSFLVCIFGFSFIFNQRQQQLSPILDLIHLILSVLICNLCFFCCKLGPPPPCTFFLLRLTFLFHLQFSVGFGDSFGHFPLFINRILDHQSSLTSSKFCSILSRISHRNTSFFVFLRVCLWMWSFPFSLCSSLFVHLFSCSSALFRSPFRHLHLDNLLN